MLDARGRRVPARISACIRLSILCGLSVRRLDARTREQPARAGKGNLPEVIWSQGGTMPSHVVSGTAASRRAAIVAVAFLVTGSAMSESALAHSGGDQGTHG